MSASYEVRSRAPISLHSPSSIKGTPMPPASNTPDRQAAAASARDLLTMGVLLFAPVLLVFPLSIFGETFGWVAARNRSPK